MTDDELGDLLRAADAGSRSPLPPTRSPAELIVLVRRRATRHNRRQHVATAAAALLMMVAVGLVWTEGPQQPPVETNIVAKQQMDDAEQLRREARDLMAAITGEQQRFNILLAAEVERLEADLPDAGPDPAVLVGDELERAALTLVYRGSQLLGHGPDYREKAHDEFRRAADLFPNTLWAGVARERLNNPEMGEMQ